MKKYCCLFLVCFLPRFLSAQELPSLPACADIKEKLISISKSFENLLPAFKDKELEKNDDHTIYSSLLSLCDKKAEILERKPGIAAYSVVLYFKFISSAYATNQTRFQQKEQQVLKAMKEVFGKWKFEEESEENRSLVYYSFTDKPDPYTGFTRSVILNTTHMADYSEFMLTFSYYNY